MESALYPNLVKLTVYEKSFQHKNYHFQADSAAYVAFCRQHGLFQME